jgi:hypothetical protein
MAECRQVTTYGLTCPLQEIVRLSVVRSFRPYGMHRGVPIENPLREGSITRSREVR